MGLADKMGTEWMPTDEFSTYQPNTYSSISGLPRHESATRSSKKPPQPRQNPGRHQSKSHREPDRSVSQRRRFYSTSGPRSNRREKQVIVKQQPSGWYQAEHITRNLSLAPRLPSYEPLITYSISAGDQARRKRRARRNRRSMSKWPGQNRFPSPSVFSTTLGLLRELPCARLHYDSFRRIFPTLPTRTMKEKKFRSEAAKQLPFAKYPDDQLKDVIDSTCQSITVSTGKDSQSTSWHKTMDSVPPRQPMPEVSQNWQTEGDTQLTNEVSEASENESEEKENEDELLEEDEDENDEQDVETDRRIDAAPQKDFNIDHTEQSRSGQSLISPRKQQKREANLNSTNINKPSTPISEDFLSLTDTENRIATGLINRKTEEESLPYIDVDQDMNPMPLATYDDTTKYGDISACRLSDKSSTSGTRSKGELLASSLEPVVMAELPPLKHLTQHSLVSAPKAGTEQSYVHSGQKTEVVVPRPQATVWRMSSGLPCTVCSQVAYPAERLEADGNVFHVACFRCHQCSTLLQRGSWNLRGTQYYCNPCHRRIALQTLRH